MNLKAEVVNSIVEWAKACQIEKVILFGSRARGDNKSRSDIDLAVSGGNISEFSTGVEEEIPTLLCFDVVNLDGMVQEELREAISREGLCCMKKLDNFESAVKNLKEIYQYEEPYDNVVLTGLVGLYEICFEQAWKAMKEMKENRA